MTQSGDVKTKTNLHLSPGYFRSLAYQFRCNAEILRSPQELSPRRREIMATLFDSLAQSAQETSEVLSNLKEWASSANDLSKCQLRRMRINKGR